MNNGKAEMLQGYERFFGSDPPNSWLDVIEKNVPAGERRSIKLIELADDLIAASESEIYIFPKGRSALRSLSVFFMN